MVTGDVPMLTATGYADLIAIVEEGRLLAMGTMEELADSASPRVQSYFRPGL